MDNQTELQNQLTLRSVLFHRDSMLKKPQQEHLPTLADVDEHKLPAIEKLLLKMHEFHGAMKSKGILLQPKDVHHPHVVSEYRLTDTEYSKSSKSSIYLYSHWFDPKEIFALHAGFEFRMYVNQEVHPEIGDWFRSAFKHVGTTPFAFTSEYDCSADTYLKDFYNGERFFKGLHLGEECRNWEKLEEGLSFNTELFNTSVDYTCLVFDKLISRKEFLTVRKD